jgi:hypothetical protein
MQARKIAVWLYALLLLSLSSLSCGGGGSGSGGTAAATPSSGTPTNITVSVSPATATLPRAGTEQFTATVSGTSNTAVTWSAGGVAGGNATVGLISASGMYVAPSTLPNPVAVTIRAVSAADSTRSGTAFARVNDNVEAQRAPIKLGTSGGNATDTNVVGNKRFCCSGTLGSLVTRGGDRFILSNNHVLDKSDQGVPGEPISQPGLADANCSQLSTVANLSQAVPLSNTNNVDAAIAKVAPGQVDTSGSILDLAGIGQPAPPSSTVAAPGVRQPVAKSGDATGLTCSTIQVIDALVQVTYSTQCQGGTQTKINFDNQVAISGTDFSDNGDSGSLIVASDSSRPVALLYAGSSTGTIGNPIQSVLAQLKDPNTGEVPQFVGGPDHPVACPASPQSQVTTQAGATTTSTLPQEEVSRAMLAKNHRGIELLQDPAVSRVEVGQSEDNPKQSALVLVLNGRARMPIPREVDGVRTKIVVNSESAAAQTQTHQSAATIAPLSEAETSRARSVKEARAHELMSHNSAIVGVGVGASDDSPGEAALVIFVEQGKSVALPNVIDGLRTRVVATDPFRTYNWGKRTVKACSRR